jgi:hypothetical protein
MTIENDEHPSKETLTEYALGTQDPQTETHLQQCPECARYVKEMQSVTTALRDIPDIEVPEKLFEKIQSGTSAKSFFGLTIFDFRIEMWHKNPLLMYLALIGMIVFLYMFFAFSDKFW